MILFLLFFANTSWALTETELAESVIKHFPLIQEATFKARAAAAEVEAASGAFDHKLKIKATNRFDEKYDNEYLETKIERITPFYGLSLVGGHRLGNGNFPGYDGFFNTSSAGEVFGGFILPLLQGFKTDLYRTNLEIAKVERVIAKAEIQLKQFVYVHKALSLYYNFLFLNKKITIHQELLDIAGQRQEILQKRFKAGDIEELKVLDNQRSIDKRKEELAKTTISLEKVTQELSLYYRTSEGAPRVFREKTLPKEELLPHVIPSLGKVPLPQVNVLSKELEIGELKSRLYDQSRLPTLNLEVIGAKELNPSPPDDFDHLKIGLKFSFPLENRKATGKTVATEYKNQGLKRQLLYLKENLNRQLAFSSEALRVTKARWEIISSELDKSLKLADAERKRWQQGASDLYIVALREQDAADTNIKRWSAWLEYQQHILDVKLYSGTILPPIL